MNDDGTMGFAEFARHKGWRPGYVTGLRHAGRLVLTEDGKRVRVAESLVRIEATRDPSKVGVAERHAAGRAERAQAAGEDVGADVSPLPPRPAAAAPRADDDEGGSRYQRARALNEQYKAAQAKLDYEERIGKLVDAAQVRAAGAEAGAAVRRSLERLPNVISAQVDERDRDRVHTLITDHVEQAMTDLSRIFDRASVRKESA